MARPMCTTCHYPQTRCVCDSIKPVLSQTRFDILQHPSEVKAAKNTARLCQLCMPNVHIWIGEKAEDFQALQQHIEIQKYLYQTAILYPSDTSLSVTQWQAAASENAQVNEPLNRIIVLDGTWKKAYKLLQLNPWLNEFPAIKLEQVTSAYRIRKSPKPGGVSTLEAIAALLSEIEPCTDTQPLFQLFEVRQSHFDNY